MKTTAMIDEALAAAELEAIDNASTTAVAIRLVSHQSAKLAMVRLLELLEAEFGDRGDAMLTEGSVEEHAGMAEALAYVEELHRELES
jgi:hypothetical protein